MKLTCITVDDEPLALRLLQQYAGRMQQLELLQTFDDALEAKEFLQNNKIDLLFADINMPGITGLDLVRSLADKPLVIFTTAYKNFAYEGFELEAVDYLLKPISFDRFEKAVLKAAEYYQYKLNAQSDTKQHIFVRSEYRIIRIDTDNIIYIEGLEDYIKIHLQNERPLLTLMTMKAILEKLPAGFTRIHRSYIIHTAKVKAVTGKKVVLNTGTELPVSDSYIDFIRKWIGEK